MVLVKLLSFGLIHFHFHYEKGGVGGGHPVLVFCQGQAAPAAEATDVWSGVRLAIVSLRQCNIAVLRAMIAAEFYGLLP